MKSKKIALAFISFGIFSFLIVSDVEAVSISPLTFELNANPGETVTNVLRVTNDTDIQSIVTVEVEDFVAIGEEGQVSLESPDEAKTFSLASWVSVSPNTFVLEPRASQAVEFTINVPGNAEPGGHYSSVLATVTAGSPQQGGSAISQRVGTLLLMNVSGDVLQNVRAIEILTCLPEGKRATLPAEDQCKSFFEYGPIDLITRFENTGTVHSKPAGSIRVRNMFGKEVAEINLPQRNVLPNSIRRVSATLDGGNMFGKYEATLAAVNISNQQPLTAVTTFWVIPWKPVLGTLIALLITLYLLVKGRGRIRSALRILAKGA